MNSKINVCFYVALVSSGVLANPVSNATESAHDELLNTEEFSCPDLDRPEYLPYLADLISKKSQNNRTFYRKILGGMLYTACDISWELELESQAVRSRLNEVKKTEMDRLGKRTGSDAGYIDYSNPDTFEAGDLERLQATVRKDFAGLDLAHKNPKITFHLQDLDGNGAWSYDEFYAYFKMYLRKNLFAMCLLGASDYEIRSATKGWKSLLRSPNPRIDSNHDGRIDYGEFELANENLMEIVRQKCRGG